MGKSNKYQDSTLFAVAGDPVMHSRSPQMFNRALRLYGIKASYTRISANSADEVYHIMKSAGFAGINITAPFKGDMLGFVDKPTPVVGFIKAVNTVYWSGSSLIGDNTDYVGVLGAIQSNRFQASGKKCIVLGTGFAARAAVFALTFYGGNVTIAGRNIEKAKSISVEFNCSFAGVNELKELVQDADLILSALASGVNLLKQEWLKKEVTLCDANYIHSEIKKVALAADCEYIDGITWLLSQALPVFNIFTGRTCDRRIFFSASMDKLLNPNKLVYLTGFMASGKTTIGKALAEAIGYDFVDMDSLIEKREGRSISQIFESDGESRFREVESAILQELSGRTGCVISTGGGIVESDENISIMKQSGITVWLHSSLDVCLQRITGDASGQKSRPLAAELGLDKLVIKRLPLYCAASDLLVSSENSIDSVVGRIQNELKFGDLI